MKSLEFKSVVYREGKYFVAQCLNVDVSSFGNSEKEALANLTEAVELYQDSAFNNPSVWPQQESL